MNPDDDHPKPEEREKFARAGRWKIPAASPDQSDQPTVPLIRPVNQAVSGEPEAPGEFTRRVQSTEAPAASPKPPTTSAQPGPSEFTRMFQAPAQPSPHGTPPRQVPVPRV